MYVVKQLSQDEITSLELQFPYSTIREFQILEDGMALGYAGTREEADAEMKKWEGRDAIRDTIEEKLPILLDELEQQGSWYGISSTEVHDMLKGAL